MASPVRISVYLETGAKRAIASAVEWPGWCRGGRDETLALDALLAYGPRYAAVLGETSFGFRLPRGREELEVAERLPGDSGTDYGVPSMTPAADREPVDEGELARFQALLAACWDAFERAVSAAEGRDLKKGPRGGGRELDGVVRHVLEANAGYMGQISRKIAFDATAGLADERQRIRLAVAQSLTAAVDEGVPPGPRGGVRWTPRYFVRRVAYHLVDHTWELEDRIL